MMFVGWWWGC